MKRQALGRGLDVLLPQTAVPSTALLELDLDQIQPNTLQPRIKFEVQKLEELAASIKENGVLQPIVVRQSENGYEIVAGERRWRAAQKASLDRIPAIVQDVSDERMLEIALVENIQRDELNPIEEAHAYELLVEQFSLTQEEIARRVGRSRTAITNTLRLLRLPRAIQERVLNGEISMGHARALLPLPTPEQIPLAQQIVARGLSVREVERRVQRYQNPSKPRPVLKDANVRAAEQKLEEHWKTHVEIRGHGTRGQIVLHFHSSEELDRLHETLLSCPQA
ncbi:ParB/RepB/Spo0J family partition protein [Acidobacteria bacterium AH-259-L09]|nr:ParB/RepB/Spo0J family partition protein [Acidobacteria bacterium AH-259-L09]